MKSDRPSEVSTSGRLGHKHSRGAWIFAVTALVGVALGASCTSKSEVDEPVGETEQPISTCVLIQRGGAIGSVVDTQIASDPNDPSKASTNYGSPVVMNTGGVSGGERQALMQFDISGVVPPGATLTSATLTVKQNNDGPAVVSVHRVTAPWAESTVTWNSLGGAFDATPVASFGPVYDGPVSIDVTQLVSDWLGAVYPNDGLLLKEPLTHHRVYASSETLIAGNRPSLNVCYDLISCVDGIQNQGETGVDCGGPCGPCPTCSDGIQNQGELAVDCGGPCPACPSNVLATWGGTSWYQIPVTGLMTDANILAACQAAGLTVPCVTNGSCVYNDQLCSPLTGETQCSGPMADLAGFLCGITIPSSCAALNNTFQYMGNAWFGGCGVAGGNWCVQGDTYSNGLALCTQGLPPTCQDGIQNQGETSVDCGGPCGPVCTCSDATQNQGETGVDCGGPCPACPSCNDGIQNQGETGVDCGGPCGACPTCSDGIQNQSETDVDCGGPCPACPQTLLAVWGGLSWYQVPVTGYMTAANVYAACQAAGLSTPCQSMSSGPPCPYNDNLCSPTPELACGKPMDGLSHYLCGNGVPPSSCPALYNTFQYLGSWPTGSCGADAGQWCIDGSAHLNGFALCTGP